MSTWIWAAVLVAAVFAAEWGSDHLAEPLRRLRKQWGLSAAAGGSLIGIATASPEVGVNITSAVRDVSDIGLGAMLGSTAIGIPDAALSGGRVLPEGVVVEEGSPLGSVPVGQGLGEEHRSTQELLEAIAQVSVPAELIHPREEGAAHFRDEALAVEER